MPCNDKIVKKNTNVAPRGTKVDQTSKLQLSDKAMLNRHSSTEAVVYTTNADSLKCIEAVKDKLYILFFMTAAMAKITGVPHNLIFSILMPLVIKPQELGVLQNTIATSAKKIVNLVNDNVTPTLLSWGTFFTSSIRANTVTINDRHLNNVSSIDDDDEGYVMISIDG